jgi:hypothetical protein
MIFLSGTHEAEITGMVGPIANWHGRTEIANRLNN